MKPKHGDTSIEIRRLEAAEIKLLRPPGGYSLLDYQANEHIRNKLEINAIITIPDIYRNHFIIRNQPKQNIG